MGQRGSEKISYCCEMVIIVRGSGVKNSNMIRNKVKIRLKYRSICKKLQYCSEIAFAYQSLPHPQKRKYAAHEKYDFSE